VIGKILSALTVLVLIASVVPVFADADIDASPYNAETNPMPSKGTAGHDSRSVHHEDAIPEPPDDEDADVNLCIIMDTVSCPGMFPTDISDPLYLPDVPAPYCRCGTLL